jgi:hypothetical protein
MGALRAAELHRYGMLGFGAIFEAYRDGLFDADDEVGMVHGEAEDGYPVFVDALVNIRASLRIAVTAGVLDQPTADRLITVARRLPFTARSWQTLLQLADVGTHRIQVLARQLRELRIDQKHTDAMTALRSLAAGIQRPTPQWQRPLPTIWSKRWAELWTPGTPMEIGHPPTTVRVRDIDVLTLLRLSAEPGWLYEPALEQLAAWHTATPNKPLSEAAGDSRLRKLERIAHLHLQQRGLCDEHGLPPLVLASWLSPVELASTHRDPVHGSALLASRTLLHDPALPELSHLLALIKQDPRMPQWQQLTAQVLQQGAELALQQPALDLKNPKPDQLDELFRRRWKTDNLRVAKAIRGFVTDESFYRASVPFAPAAATNTLPKLHVGRLGPSNSRFALWWKRGR